MGKIDADNKGRLELGAGGNLSISSWKFWASMDVSQTLSWHWRDQKKINRDEKNPVLLHLAMENQGVFEPGLAMQVFEEIFQWSLVRFAVQF